MIYILRYSEYYNLIKQGNIIIIGEGNPLKLYVSMLMKSIYIHKNQLFLIPIL